MKHLIISLGCVALFCSLVTAENDVLRDVEKLLEEGRHEEALTLVNTITASHHTPMTKALVLRRGARFLEHEARAFRRALATYERILELELPADAPVLQDAQDAAQRLRALHREHRHVYAALAEIAQSPATKDTAAAMIAKLESLAAAHPAFPEQDAIHYYLGLYRFLNEEYAKAYRELRRASTHHAVAAKLPNLPRLLDQAHDTWLYSSARTAAWSIIGTFLIITAVLFFAARPWRWVGIRQWVFMLLLVVLWWAVFALSSKWIGAHAQEAVTRTQSESTHRFSTFGNPAAGVFKALFRYGLVGIIGIGVLVIATVRCRLRITVAVANTVAAFLLFTSLMFVFFDRYGTQGSVSLMGQSPSLRAYLQAVVSYTTDEIAPFMLINPRAFPHLAISNIHDPMLRDWVMRYLPRTTEESVPHDSL